jgi:hypothetical protein
MVTKKLRNFKLVVQTTYKFLSCKKLQICNKACNFKSKHNVKTSGNDDFKNIFSNWQHQDHRITTTDDTLSIP